MNSSPNLSNLATISVEDSKPQRIEMIEGGTEVSPQLFAFIPRLRRRRTTASPTLPVNAQARANTAYEFPNNTLTNLPCQTLCCKALYYGPVDKFGQADGEGELIWSNGDRYIGSFSNGKQHGQGALYFENGSEFEGSWECGHMHGMGNHKLCNGDVFIGNFVSNRRNGYGTMIFANGDKYSGEWKDGLMHGHGQYDYANGQTFEGTFQMGKRHGKGRHQFSDKSFIIQNFVQDKQDGVGVLWSADCERMWRMVGSTRKGPINPQRANRISSRWANGRAN